MAVRCWPAARSNAGGRTAGRLGNGTTLGHTSQCPVTGISTATALGAGYGFSLCAAGQRRGPVLGSERLWPIGRRDQHVSSSTPVSVSGISTATALAVGDDHSLRAAGQWRGSVLGSELMASSAMAPIRIRIGPVTVIGISRATAHRGGEQPQLCIARQRRGPVLGDRRHGELGDGSNTVLQCPGVCDGDQHGHSDRRWWSHICAVLRNGSVKCWGDNAYGQLGNGTTTDSNIPVRVSAINAPVRLAAGGDHTCALFSGGMMTCWGWDNYGQLGNRRQNQHANPLPINVIGTPGVVWQSSDSTKATITDRGVATGSCRRQHNDHGDHRWAHQRQCGAHSEVEAQQR